MTPRWLKDALELVLSVFFLVMGAVGFSIAATIVLRSLHHA